ncbi:Crp/Fnr family transcriptional regulator [Ramlibacter sp. WS9]|nr:Crp/Fnr family transcriptional regulator [Ramlibacter sp. WS9]
MDRFQVARFLRMQPWFTLLAPAMQDELLRCACAVHARKGEVLLQAGEAARGWYAVLWGFVKLQSPSHDEQASAFLALTGGEWFGEGSAMKDEPRRYEVVALRDSELLCLPGPQFRALLATSLPFNHAVMRHMNLRLGQAMAIIEANRTGSLEERLALYLSRLFWHGLRKLNLSQEELGCLAGMSRQAANRGLAGLARRGLVELRFGRVVQVDQDALGQFLGAAAPAAEPMRQYGP